MSFRSQASRNRVHFMVPRCLSWAVSMLRWQLHVEFSCDQVDHCLEFLSSTISSCLGLGGLYQSVDALARSIGDLAVEPAQDAIPVTFDGARSIDDRIKFAVSGPEIPFLQEISPSCTDGWL
jgi:hypothetical protein